MRQLLRLQISATVSMAGKDSGAASGVGSAM